MTEIIVIGAGVVGCSIALELARRGERPLVVDRLGEAGHGSTSASCGIVRRFYSTRPMAAMAQESAYLWEDWGGYLGLAQSSELARFERCGMLFLPSRITQSTRATVRTMQEFGIDVELLDHAGLAREFPWLNLDSHAPVRKPTDDDFFETLSGPLEGGVFERDAGQVVSPVLATRNLRDAAQAAGARFQLGCGVARVDAGGKRRFDVGLDDGRRLECDVLVNVAGPHSAKVNQMVGVDLGIELRALRREVCALRTPASAPAGLPIVADIDSGTYMRPEAGGHDLAIGSLDPEGDAFEWVDADAWDEHASVEGFERQVLRSMKRFPALELERKRGIAGLYDVTLLDWNPVLDVTDLPGYYVAVGTSGSSFKTAPVLGRALSTLIDAVEGGHDHDAHPVRLQLERTNFELDLAFLSRKRGAHASSGTVLG